MLLTSWNNLFPGLISLNYKIAFVPTDTAGIGFRQRCPDQASLKAAEMALEKINLKLSDFTPDPAMKHDCS